VRGRRDKPGRLLHGPRIADSQWAGADRRVGRGPVALLQHLTDHARRLGQNRLEAAPSRQSGPASRHSRGRWGDTRCARWPPPDGALRSPPAARNAKCASTRWSLGTSAEDPGSARRARSPTCPPILLPSCPGQETRARGSWPNRLCGRQVLLSFLRARGPRFPDSISPSNGRPKSCPVFRVHYSPGARAWRGKANGV
jgi:hypothetical protein